MATGLFTWAKLLPSLHEFYDKASECLDWLAWAQEATGNIAIEQAPPPSPLSPEKFQEALDRARKRIDELPLPTFYTHLPDSGPVPTAGFDVTRQEIRMRISDLLNNVSEIFDARNAIDYFSTLESALNNQLDMLNILAREMWELATKFPLKVLVETLGFLAIDVQYTYIPFVAETQDKLNAKRKAATAALATRLIEARGAANEIKNVLTVEAIDLRSAVDRLEQLDAEVFELQDAVIKAIQARDESATNVERQKYLRDAAEMDVAETEELLATAQGNVANLKARIKQVNAAINVPYDCPVSHVPWNQCKDPDHQQYRNAYLANQQGLRNDLNGLQSDLKSAQDLVFGASEELVRAKSRLALYESRLRTASELLKIAETRLMEDQGDMKSKALFAMEEKHRLRADIFASENRSDQSHIHDVIGQLGVAP